MTFKEITELIKLVKKLELAEFKMQDGEFSISLRSNLRTKSQTINQPTMIPMQAAQPMQHQQISNIPSTAASVSKLADVVELPDLKPSKDVSDSGNYLEVKSPIVGTFYRSSSPDKPPFIKVGDTINVGDVVCIVEAMKLFNEIESEIAGKIVKVVVEDASPVEYDQVLFLVDPKG